jgi:hypothetical protein
MGVSRDQADGAIWFDGKPVPWKDANIHVLTHGLHYASCVFEGERAYGGSRLHRVLHHRHRRRGDAGLRNRAVEVHPRGDLEALMKDYVAEVRPRRRQAAA